jgi:hypothetical protein
MMPILHSPGVMTPGQFGPIRRDLDFVQGALDLDHVETGTPSVMQTMSGISASMASRIASAAKGWRHVDHGGVGAGLGPLRHRTRRSAIPGRFIGLPRSPPLPGVTPPTICVPK